jgi:hypothetical protein
VFPPRLAVRLAWASALSILIAYTAAASIGRTTHGFMPVLSLVAYPRLYAAWLPWSVHLF